MKLPPLYAGRLVRRYKRFLADIETPQGPITAHCPNTGAMSGCAEPDSRVWYSISDNPKRKYAATLELVETAGGLCSVNTGRANHLVAEALTTGPLRERLGSGRLRAEVKVPDTSSRFDFCIEVADPEAEAAGESRISEYIEVKSVTLLQTDGWGAFPDAVSDRATRHIQELVRQLEMGRRATLVFCTQHAGITKICPAAAIDPTYAEQLVLAHSLGVQVLALGINFALADDTTPLSSTADRLIPFDPRGPQNGAAVSAQE